MTKDDNPIRYFTRQLKKHGAFTGANAKMITLFYLKLLLEEPFRLMEDKHYKETLEEVTLPEDPVFIIGHWRSGTTYTQFLLSQDPQFSYHNKYQNFFPDNFLVTEKLFKPFMERLMKMVSPVRNWQDNIQHNMNFDAPTEFEGALMNEVSRVTYHWGHVFPQAFHKYFNKYLFMEDISEKDLQAWRNTMVELLKKAYVQKPGRRMLIKNPGDTARISYLLDLFPGARFVFIHRNPYEVFYSNKKLWQNVLGNISMQQVSDEQMNNIILETYVKLHRKYMEERKQIPEKQLIEVAYEDITKEPMKHLHDIYHKLEVPGLTEAMPYFEEYLKHAMQWKKPRYMFDPNDVALVNKHWDFAFKEWNYDKLDNSQLENEAG